MMVSRTAKSRNEFDVIRVSAISVGIVIFLLGWRAACGVGQEVDSVSGRWEWHGKWGWQRLVVDLGSEGGRGYGTIVMGPGTTRATSEQQFWEYFFEPARFKISKLDVEGQTVRFEHTVNNGQVVRYRGTIEGDHMFVTRELERSDSIQVVEFTLERVH